MTSNAPRVKRLAEAHIGLVGFGAIARAVEAELAAGEAPRMTVLLRPGSASRAAVPAGVRVVSSIDEMIAARPDLVVEAAGQTAVATTVAPLLRAGIDAVVASVGALAGDGLADIVAAADAGGARLLVPAGAIGGLDYLRAVSALPELRVRYTSRKPVAAWAGELEPLGHPPGSVEREVVLFEGAAGEAARLYPQNLNVAMTIALAVGLDRVVVRVVADPAVSRNTHEIRTESRAGVAEMVFANAPSPDNPKTSLVTAYGLLATIRGSFGSLAA